MTPNGVRCCAVTVPRPLQLAHFSGVVPALLPEPAQSVHDSTRMTPISFSHPKAAS